jgi:hypothetical protein
VIAVVGLWLGWIANKIYWQRRVASVVGADYGWVRYDWEMADAERDEPPGPRWLRRIIGDEPFQEIADISISGWPTPRRYSLEKVVEWIVRGAPRTRCLVVDVERLGGGAYPAIGKLASMETLELTIGEGPTDDQISCLSKLTNLKTVEIHDGHRLTDKSLDTLSRLPNLESLRIDDMTLTDRGLEHLSRCKKLDSLQLTASESHVSGAGLRRLKDIRSLGYLQFWDGTWDIIAGGSEFAPIREPAISPAIDKAIKESVNH